MEAWRQELYHHGIKGQRWGVRKGPPYPLDAQDHSAAEKRAGWRRSLNETTSERKQTPAPDKGTDEHKKKILTATATVAALGVIGAVAVSNPKIRDLAATGARATEGVFELIKTEKMWMDGDFSKIWRAEAALVKKTYDPAFYKGWVESMKAMEATDKRAQRAQKRALIAQRRSDKKAREKFIHDHNRKVAEAEWEKRKQEIQERIKKANINLQINRALIEDELDRRLFGDTRTMSTAELLARAKRSRYT